MWYDYYKEKQIADELKETIAKVCTARLYARMAERMELTHTDQMVSKWLAFYNDYRQCS